MIPWEEDPRYQEGNFKFLVWLVAFATVVIGIASLITGNWEPLGTWLWVLLIGGIAVSIYAGIVWSLGHLVLLAIRALRRLRH